MERSAFLLHVRSCTLNVSTKECQLAAFKNKSRNCIWQAVWQFERKKKMPHRLPIAWKGVCQAKRAWNNPRSHSRHTYAQRHVHVYMHKSCSYTWTWVQMINELQTQGLPIPNKTKKTRDWKVTQRGRPGTILGRHRFATDRSGLLLFFFYDAKSTKT